MKYQGKCIALLLGLVVIFMLTSCAEAKDVVEAIEAIEVSDVEETAIETVKSVQLTKLVNEESVKIDDMSKEIIRCFTKRDKEGLKLLFSEQARLKPNFTEEVDKAFEFFLCDIYLKSEYDTSASGGESMAYGKRVEWNVQPDISYISVLCDSEDGSDMENRYYSIYYDWQIVYEEDQSQVGIQDMKIELLNVDSIKIGE